MSQERHPEIYDISIDEFRKVTQKDVDKLVLIRNCYGNIRRLQRELQDALLLLDEVKDE